MTRTRLISLALAALVSLAGCGKKTDPNRPKTYPVTGTVTLGGSPVEGATVTFQLTGKAGSAVGLTDAKGQYKLTTFGGGDGAQAGEYKVAIFKYDRPAAQAAPAGQIASGAIDEKTYKGTDDASAAPPKNLLPDKYLNAQTSGLTAKVSDTGKNNIDFPLQP